MTFAVTTRRIVVLLLLAAVYAVPVNAQEDDFAIVGVDVIPMDVERIVKNQVVIVREGIIQSVSDLAETTIPADLPQVDGRGRFLIPGLADLHVHVRNEDELLNHAAWGVTTIMHLGGSGESGAQQLRYRREIISGDRLGPNIYTTDRIVDGDPAIATGAHSVKTAEEARRVVRDLKINGFDFVKIYNNVSNSVFDTIVDEAKRQGLSVIGHVPRSFDPLTALSSGQNAVAHTEELFFTYFGGPRSTENMPRDYSPDLDKLPELIDVLLENNVAVMPDLGFTFGNLVMWDSLEHLWADPEIPYLHPGTASMWRAGNINRRSEIENFMVREQWKYDLLRTLTFEFEKAGVLQVIGTDASLPGLFPGKAAHRELTELVKSGLSNFASLAVGTRNAGEFVRRYIDSDARFGQIVPGYRADLLLLEGNPLEDIRNAKLVSGVSINGRFNDKPEFDRLRVSMADRYAALNAVADQVDIAVTSAQAEKLIEDLLRAHKRDREIAETIEARINAAGNAAGTSGELHGARELFGMNTRLFPNSANTWDSLAEVTSYLGDRQSAIEFYRKALALDPGLTNPKKQIEKLLNDKQE